MEPTPRTVVLSRHAFGSLLVLLAPFDVGDGGHELGGLLRDLEAVQRGESPCVVVEVEG